MLIFFVPKKCLKNTQLKKNKINIFLHCYWYSHVQYLKRRLWLFQLWKLLQTIKLKSKALQFATANSRTSNLRWSEALRWNNVSSHWLTWSKRQILSMAICILFHNQVDKVYGLWSVHPERESHKVCVPYWIDFYRYPFFFIPKLQFSPYLTCTVYLSSYLS